MTFHRRTALVFYRTVLEKDIKTLVCLDTSQIMRIRTSHHTWVIRIASEDNNYKTIQNKAVIALPDGGPLSKFSREQGHEGASRVTGPDLMQRILKKSAGNGWKHYFYGSTQETLDKLKSVINKQYEGTIICGMMSPPFRPLTVAEDEQIIKEINEADSRFHLGRPWHS